MNLRVYFSSINITVISADNIEKTCSKAYLVSRVSYPWFTTRVPWFVLIWRAVHHMLKENQFCMERERKWLFLVASPWLAASR